MSNFDVAVGMTQTALDSTLADLFKNPVAKSKLFSGEVTKSLGSLGEVKMVYEIIKAPTIVLKPPTSKQWGEAHKIKKGEKLPTGNVFQLLMSDVKGTVTYEGTDPIKAEGAIYVYGVFEVANNRLSLTPKAVWIDESKFSAWDKVIVNGILIPKILEIADSLLSGIPLPAIPSYAGLTFQDIVAEIVNDNELVGATALKGNDAPDLSGYQNPGQSIYVISDFSVINKVLDKEVVGLKVKRKKKKGSDAWYTAGSITATVKSISASAKNNKILIHIGLKKVSGYGELGGTGVGITKAVLCPIGAAADAIANPSDWDKVISSFNITYKPDPLGVPVTFDAKTENSGGENPEQYLQVSVGNLSSVEVIAAPKWSGSVTGTVLATAAAAFIDLLSVIFKGLIVNDILKKDAQNINVYKIPAIQTSVDGVKIDLAVPDGQLATLSATGQLVQNFTINFS